MRRLIAFEQVSLDGYFADADGDMSWAHKQDPEWNEFVGRNASGESPLLLGRVTYELMAGFWPTPAATETMPVVAEGMNRVPKLVVSRTLEKPSWANSTVIRGDMVAAVKRLKRESGPDMAILGSGSVVSQLAAASLIDELQIVVNPVVLGRGRTLFEGVEGRIELRLARTRTFGNGSVLLSYEPAGPGSSTERRGVEGRAES